MTTFHVDASKVRTWQAGGRWHVAVDGVPVPGAHASEARAAGAGLLQLMFASRPTPRRTGARGRDGTGGRDGARRGDGARSR